MLEKIQSLLQEVEGLTANSAEEIEQLRIKYLSKKGVIPALMADFRNVPADQKKEIGIKINELKDKAQEKINALRDAFAVQETEVNHL
ncbi:MAG: phenylalanine--tRNA ligase subunit alpha, partial [Bacteroidaceae bacterium]|nr:phenylalanine--tRNA ligase subunit alpha [Bacteroidaceae bacterium]